MADDQQRTAEVFDKGKPSGLSTDMELKLLTDRWPSPERGQLFPYEEILATLGMATRDGTRFRSVVNRWKNHLRREHNLVAVAVPNEGYRILDENERVDHIAGLRQQALRRIRRGHKLTTTTDEGMLDDAHRVRHEHQLKHLQAVAQLMHAQRKEAARLPSPVGKMTG